MNRIFHILILISVSTSVFARQSDDKGKQVASDTVQLPMNEIDSLTEKTKQKTDAVNSKLQQVQSLKTGAPGIKETDSIKSAAQGALNKPTQIKQSLLGKPMSLEKKVAHKVDSLNPQHKVDQYNQKLQVLRKHFNHHLDSLSKLQVKDPRVSKSMDSIKKKMNNLKNAKSIKDVQKGEQQLTKLQLGLNSKVKGLESKVNKELSALNAGNIKVPNLNAPNLKVPNVSLPGVNTNLPANGLSTSLPNVTTPSLGNTNLPGGNISMPGVTQPSTGIPNGSSSLPGNELKDLSNIQKEVSQITKATGEVTKAEGELRNLNPDKLETTLEKDAQNIREVKQFSGEAMQAEQYKKMVEKWESDPEYRKELAVTKAKEQAVNHFAGQEKQLMAAMQQLTNVKKKYKDAEGVLDMFKKPVNPMKGKPFIERLRPGFNLQYQYKHESLIDFNPEVGYRISGRLTAGIGWNERWGYDFDKWKYVSQDHIYGPRAYAQVKIKTGIYGIFIPEVMNALVPPSYSSTDPGTRKWVWSWMAGIKKEFRYSKNMLGSLQVLYNLYDPLHQSPYVNKLNIRMGFEFPLKKKQATQ